MATPAPALPVFLFRPDVPYAPGVCFSCADALPESRYARCWRCSLAWRLVSGVPVSADEAAALESCLDAKRTA